MTGPRARDAIAICVVGAGPRGLTAASAEAADTGCALGEVLSGHPELSARFTPAQLANLLTPARYTGTADTLVDRALRRCQDHGARSGHRRPPR